MIIFLNNDRLKCTVTSDLNLSFSEIRLKFRVLFLLVEVGSQLRKTVSRSKTNYGG